MPKRRAYALPPTDPFNFLKTLLTSAVYPTTVLICSSRTAFISSLLASLSAEGGLERLLEPTLDTLSVARHIQTVYTPTLSHLRAWLTVADEESKAPEPLSLEQQGVEQENISGKHGKDKRSRGTLMVYNLVKIHEGTSDWSVQGLSETLAALVDSGRRMDMQILLIETTELPYKTAEDLTGTPGEDGDFDKFPEIPGTGAEIDEDVLMYNELDDKGGSSAGVTESQSIHQKRLPMLNGSSRHDGCDESNAWSGRTVEVGIVMGRWVRFARGFH